MNTNKKHKIKNKLRPNPNTNTGEKVELIPEAEEKDTKEVSADFENVPIEGSVQENVSENKVISSDKEIEPKKPKRNKNKKKQDHDETTVEKTETKESSEKFLDKILNIETENPTSNDFITPAARKKKNKHKKSDEQGETTNKITLQEDVKEKEIQATTKDQEIPVLPVLEEIKNELENKPSKKKNKKKKNRNDSERSEKADEIMSCTAAFQKLLEPKRDTTQEAEDINYGQQKSKDIALSEPESQHKAEDDSQKFKKKNKKGKAVLHPENDLLKLTELKQTEDKVQTKDYIKLDTNKSVAMEPFQDKTDVKMPSPKPKAKIAKPVERKSKNKLDEDDFTQIPVPTTEQDNVSGKNVDPNLSKQSDKNVENIFKIENKGNLTNVTELIKDELKSKHVPEDETIKIDDRDSQTNVALSQILNKKIAELNPCEKPEEIEPLPDKGNLEDLFIPISEEPKAKISKADKKRKNKTDNQATEFICTIPTIQTISIEKPTEDKNKKKDITKLNTTKYTQEKEKSPLKFEDLINIGTEKLVRTEQIPKDDFKVVNQLVLSQAEPEANIKKEIITLESEDTIKPFKPLDKKRKKSPIKQDNKEHSDILEEHLKPDISFESKSYQQEEDNIKITAELFKESNILEQPCNLKSNIKNEIIPSQSEEILKVKPFNKSQKNSLIERDNNESDKREEHIKPHTSFERKRQQEEVNIQQTNELVKDPKKTEHSCQLKEPDKERISAITDVVGKCDLKQDFTEISTLNEELQVPAQKNKKRKKSPKPPQRSETKTHIENEPINTMGSSQLQVCEDITKSEIEKKLTMAEYDTKRKVIVTPEQVPDSIDYPRSLSQLIEDPNNNVTITEIRTPEQFSIGLFNVPNVEDSRASSTTSEKKLAHIEGLQIMEYSGNEKEKTDLKSKVLEVNKDMEVLRLSIERTLAGLTCLEQKERDLEKPVETKKDNLQLNQSKEIIPLREPEAKLIIETSMDRISSEENVEQILTRSKENYLKEDVSVTPPVPARQDKGKGKSKKKNKLESHHQNIPGAQTTQQSETNQSSSGTNNETNPNESYKKETEKSEQKTEASQQKGKQSDAIERGKEQDIKQDSAYQQGSCQNDDKKIDNEPIYSTINKAKKTPKDSKNCSSTNTSNAVQLHENFEPIENFEDAMTSSIDDVNKSFEIIASENNIVDDSNNPEISITAPEEDTQKKDGKDKINPVSQPKNLLGHPDIPVPSNRTDYKKEKNKFPNARQARIKIKDSVEIESAKAKESKESQTETKKKFLKKDTTVEESVSCVTNENEEYVYKYSFRRVFLPNICHICKKELKTVRVPCNFCSLMFYCNEKHKDEGWQQHQGLCFAVSTVTHHKGQKHIYADSKNLTGHDYRLFRMQTIVACEKVLKRRLGAWEQEALLYPRICAETSCREFRQSKLKDCEGCGQIAFCADFPDHLPKVHQRWCKSYSLYYKLVHHQQTLGRLAPKLPTKVLTQATVLPDKINMVLASLYEEKIDMNDTQYAALTQIATAPLTVAYSYQLYSKGLPNIISKPTFTIHLVGAELQYEADALNKWETLFLHLKPEVMQLNVVMIGTALNPSELPLDLLGKVKLCANCRLHTRRLILHFQDKKSYYEYWDSNDFLTPDIVCAFNPSIDRATIYNGKDQWPITISTVFKQKCPFVITSYTMNELYRDLKRIKECCTTEFKVISEAKFNPFASFRPDRNFITDDEIPLLFKNFCFAVLCGD